MPRRQVQSHASSAASADQAWSVVRDFCAPWHPAIATMTAEQGGSVRRFTALGDDTTYRERLTWFSDSERSMGYRLIEGIEGCDRYDGRLAITPSKTGCAITMRASFTASAARADGIAEGTQAIFDTGVRAIAEQALSAAPSPVKPPRESAPLQRLVIDSPPRLAITHGGADSETLCLFLHGIGGNRSNWAAQLEALAPLCRVAALDLRGYGGSSLGPAQSSVDDYCADILRVQAALGARRLMLCGLSYGAWIATSFAMRHPRHLTALVVSGGCTGMSEAGPEEREAFRLSREVPMSEGKTPADFAPAVVDAIAGPQATQEVQDRLSKSMRAIPTQTYADALRCFTNPAETFDFTKIAVPTLLITGEHDRLAPPAAIKSLAKRIWGASANPDIGFEVIQGAGHVCNLESPDAYNRILARFTARVLA